MSARNLSAFRFPVLFGVVLLLLVSASTPAFTPVVHARSFSTIESRLAPPRVQQSARAGQVPLTWGRAYGGADFEQLSSIAAASDGGYVGAGTINGQQGWVLKVDQFGSQVWSNTYGTGFLYSTASASDGSHVAAGNNSAYSGWLLKLDGNGKVIWSNLYGAVNWKVGFNAVAATGDGGYILAGGTCRIYSNGCGPADGLAVKVDANGKTVWAKQYNAGKPYPNDSLRSIAQTSDGGYVTVLWRGITGFISRVLKLDALGNVVWEKEFTSAGGASLNSVAVASDGGYFGAGIEYTAPYQSGAWVIKLDASGNTLWDRMYQWTVRDTLFSIAATGDGGAIAAGESVPQVPGYTYAGLLRLDANGNELWHKTLGKSPGELQFSSVVANADGGYTVGGYDGSCHPGWSDDGVMLELDSDGLLTSTAFCAIAP